ncbi:MAG: hypothetical protein GY737_29450 [Desulfobacteraceae bacterium]|nr:hypothetical protein [Desulfobacteraceae bacterium]
MIDLSKYVDPYERRARLYPSLLCLFPVMLGLYSAYPYVYKTLSGLVALAAAVGVLQFFSHLARDRGKRLEPILFSEWGGMPSVKLLRYNDSNISTPIKIRYHEKLASKSGISAPTQESERLNPHVADQIYQSWSDYLRAKTRSSKKFPMIFKENVNYGFRRNLLGLKKYCLFSGLVALIMIASPVYQSKAFSSEQMSFGVVVSVYIIVFSLVVNRKWVKLTAYAYAKQLIEAINV